MWSSGEWLVFYREQATIWERSWESAGGSCDHLSRIKDFEKKYKNYYESGPIAYGLIPGGCRLTHVAEMARGMKIRLFFREIYDAILIPYSIPLRQKLFWTHETTKTLKPSDYTRWLVYIWSIESRALSEGVGYELWESDNGPRASDLWSFLLEYAWAIFAGLTPDLRLDRCLAACSAGYLPVAFDGDQIVCFAMTQAELRKKADSLRRAAKRRAAEWAKNQAAAPEHPSKLSGPS